MILALGVWTFLRALLGRSTAVTLENVALRHQLLVLQRFFQFPIDSDAALSARVSSWRQRGLVARLCRGGRSGGRGGGAENGGSAN
jgi:hypothetical protein